MSARPSAGSRLGFRHVGSDRKDAEAPQELSPRTASWGALRPPSYSGQDTRPAFRLQCFPARPHTRELTRTVNAAAMIVGAHTAPRDAAPRPLARRRGVDGPWTVLSVTAGGGGLIPLALRQGPRLPRLHLPASAAFPVLL